MSDVKTVSEDAQSATRPSSYHHGDLRQALLHAAEAEIQSAGVEAFSLRKVAKRAGVSHAAPAHHFGDAAGLLTALAAEGFRRFTASMQAAEVDATTNTDRILQAGLGYIAFAQDNPALFRLIFGSEKPQQENTDLSREAAAAFNHIAQLVEKLTGRSPFIDESCMSDTLAIWSVTHGLADLLSAGRLGSLQSLSRADRDDIIKGIIRRTLPE